MKTIEEEIDEYFVRPLTKIFDGGEAPEGWDIRAKAEKYNRSFHDQMWMIKFHHHLEMVAWSLPNISANHLFECLVTANIIFNLFTSFFAILL